MAGVYCKLCNDSLLGAILYDNKKRICNSCWMQQWAKGNVKFIEGEGYRLIQLEK